MSYSGLYDNSINLKASTDGKNKRAIDVQPQLIPRSKRVAQSTASKPSVPVKKPQTANPQSHVIKPTITLKDSNGNELAGMDSELSMDIQAALAELQGHLSLFHPV